MSATNEPVFIGDRIDADIAELREIAAWFDTRGDNLNGDFLRSAAGRYEVIGGAYLTALQRGTGDPAIADATLAAMEAKDGR